MTAEFEWNTMVEKKTDGSEDNYTSIQEEVDSRPYWLHCEQHSLKQNGCRKYFQVPQDSLRMGLKHSLNMKYNSSFSYKYSTKYREKYKLTVLELYEDNPGGL